jgi:hypothetical protein
VRIATRGQLKTSQWPPRTAASLILLGFADIARQNPVACKAFLRISYNVMAFKFGCIQAGLPLLQEALRPAPMLRLGHDKRGRGEGVYHARRGRPQQNHL